MVDALTVHSAIADRFGDMGDRNSIRTEKISNRACDPQNSVLRAGGQSKARGGLLQER